MRARHMVGRRQDVAERLRIERSLRPSARDLFPALQERLLSSRPLIRAAFTARPGTHGRPFNRPTIVPAIYGAPTFRNVIDENGQHV